jgi:hypothetical protein
VRSRRERLPSPLEHTEEWSRDDFGREQPHAQLCDRYHPPPLTLIAAGFHEGSPYVSTTCWSAKVRWTRSGIE